MPKDEDLAYAINNGWYAVRSFDQKEMCLYNKFNDRRMVLSLDGITTMEEVLNDKYHSKIIYDVCHRLNIDVSKNASEVGCFLNLLVSKGILSKGCGNNKNLPQKLIRQIKNQRALSRVMVAVTNNCNLTCKHCYMNWHKDNFEINHMQPDKLLNLIDEIEDLGAIELELTGGELSTYPAIDTVLTRISNSPMRLNLYSNLAFDDERFIERIVATRPRNVITSIDGFERQHDELRGLKGAHSLTLKNVLKLKNSKINVRINVIVSKYNSNIIPEFAKWLKEVLDVKYVMCGILSNQKDIKDLNISEDELASIIARYSLATCDHDLKDSISLNRNEIKTPCGVGRSMLYIDQNGDVSLCPTLTKWESSCFALGNVHDDSLSSIWSRNNIINRKNQIQCDEIKKCEFASQCKGGCRSRAFYLQGDTTAPDKFMCTVFSKRMSK